MSQNLTCPRLKQTLKLWAGGTTLKPISSLLSAVRRLHRRQSRAVNLFASIEHDKGIGKLLGSGRVCRRGWEHCHYGIGVVLAPVQIPDKAHLLVLNLTIHAV